MPLIERIVNGSKILQPVIYEEIPFYFSIWFWIAILVFIVVGGYGLYNWIKYRQKNRLLVRIHNPDLSIQIHVFRKFQGNTFHLRSNELTSDGEPQFFDYNFNPECLERGVWGKYIDYDYGVLEPISPKKRQLPHDVPQIIKFLESITNTKLLSELLLSTKFKNFVITMLVIICVLGGLCLLGLIYTNIAMSSLHPICTLDSSNTTIAVIKSALSQANRVPLT